MPRHPSLPPHSDRASQTSLLILFGGFGALVGGLLGVATPLIGDQPNSAFHEALYALIDFSLLFGTLAIWLLCGERLGRLGLAGFVVALSGIASILGPEPVMFGVDFYQLGATVFALGTGVMAVQMLRTGQFPAVGALWLGALLFGIGASMTAAPILALLARILFELAFVVAGVQIVRGVLFAPGSANGSASRYDEADPDVKGQSGGLRA